MRTLHHQRGLSFISLMVIFTVVGAVTVVVMRLVPLYMDDNSIQSAMRSVAQEVPATASVNEVRKRIGKILDVNGVSIVKAADFGLTKDAEGSTVFIEYQARAPLVANVSLVIDFEHEARLGGDGL